MGENRLIQDVRDVANELGEAPTAYQYNEAGSYGSRRLFEEYGTWGAVLEEAGLLEERAEVVASIRAVAENLGRVPTVLECQEHGGVDVKSIYEAFDSWDDALAAADIGKHSNFEPDERDLVDDLRRVNEWLGRPATAAEYEELGEWSVYTLKREFKNWTGAQAEVGCDISGRSGKKYSDDELLEDLERVYGEVGRRPTQQEYRKHGAMSYGTISYRFGEFDRACELVEERLE